MAAARLLIESMEVAAKRNGDCGWAAGGMMTRNHDPARSRSVRGGRWRTGVALRLAAGAGVLAVGCSRAPAATPACDCADPEARPAGTTGREPSRGPVAVDFRNVHLHVADGVVLEVRHLRGALTSVRENAPPTFDDIHSYSLRIDRGEVAMSPASLTRLLNDRVFADASSSIRDIEVSIEDGRLRQTGTLRKGVSVPFSILADVTVTRDGRMALRPQSVKAAGMPAKGVMKFLHLELDDLVKSNPGRGFETNGDTTYIDPTKLLPAPRVSGRVTAVRVENDRLVQVFGDGAEPEGNRAAGNYMHYRGNVLKFGRLTMNDTDMRLIDADGRDAFDFSPTQYVKQLVAGYSKNSPDGSLRVFMPDYDDVIASRR
jgi:hypothetical protein